MLFIFVVLSETEVNVKLSHIARLVAMSGDINCNRSQCFFANESTLLYIKEMVGRPLVVNSEGSGHHISVSWL